MNLTIDAVSPRTILALLAIVVSCSAPQACPAGAKVTFDPHPDGLPTPASLVSFACAHLCKDATVVGDLGNVEIMCDGKVIVKIREVK